MPSAGFEPAISRSERPQTYSLDSAANGIGCVKAAVRNTERDSTHVNIYKYLENLLKKANDFL
jgi:hypothetical protein